jgi:hypothetical protein
MLGMIAASLCLHKPLIINAIYSQNSLGKIARLCYSLSMARFSHGSTIKQAQAAIFAALPASGSMRLTSRQDTLPFFSPVNQNDRDNRLRLVANSVQGVKANEMTRSQHTRELMSDMASSQDTRLACFAHGFAGES